MMKNLILIAALFVLMGSVSKAETTDDTQIIPGIRGDDSRADSTLSKCKISSGLLTDDVGCTDSKPCSTDNSKTPEDSTTKTQ